ncbi:MAG: hypothetical protein NZ534_02795 [Bacteroidia bacterium]|nr:hypothetical protein [Bacteroidia bacterium]
MIPSEQAAQFYDKTSKRCLLALASWFYLHLQTGVRAVVGKELSQELIDFFGKRRRICDALFELLEVWVRGKRGRGLLHLDVQIRAKGDEVRRAAGYKGMILDSERFADIIYFVQAFIFLTALPEDFDDCIVGFPDDARLWAIDMTRVDGLRLLELDIPEAAVFAALSAVVPRNLLIQGVVKILNAVETFEERALWIEACFAFGRLRKDHKIFNMELKQELERTAASHSRRQELQFIFGDLIEEGYQDGYQKGQSEGYQKGQSEGRLKERIAFVRALLEQGVDPAVIAAAAGTTSEQIAQWAKS